LEADIRALADPESQDNPKFQSSFLYTRMTAKAMRRALIDQNGWTDLRLLHVNTIGEILKRLGYKLRRAQKTKPLKKVPQIDVIFANVRRENQSAAADDVVRISMDAKAKVDVGDFSRDGQTRASEALSALDHDTQTKKKLVPQGILNVTTGLLTILIGHRTRPVISSWTAWNSGGRRTRRSMPAPGGWRSAAEGDRRGSVARRVAPACRHPPAPRRVGAVRAGAQCDRSECSWRQCSRKFIIC
jgi:hypothetical protein